MIRAVDYRAIDELTLEVDTNCERPDVYRLIISEPGKTMRWTIEEHFKKYPKEIAGRVMRDYAHAKELASSVSGSV